MYVTVSSLPQERTRNQEPGEEEERRAERQRAEHARQRSTADGRDAGEGPQEEARLQEQEQADAAGGAHPPEDALQRQPRSLGLPRLDALGKVSSIDLNHTWCVIGVVTFYLKSL